MAADTTLLQGEVSESPEQQLTNVEEMLAAFLKSLLQEQQPERQAKS